MTRRKDFVQKVDEGRTPTPKRWNSCCTSERAEGAVNHRDKGGEVRIELHALEQLDDLCGASRCTPTI